MSVNVCECVLMCVNVCACVCVHVCVCECVCVCVGVRSWQQLFQKYTLVSQFLSKLKLFFKKLTFKHFVTLEQYFCRDYPPIFFEKVFFLIFQSTKRRVTKCRLLRTRHSGMPPTSGIGQLTWARAQCYKTFFVRKLRIFVQS
jgi:hypothetical protein